MITMFKVYCFLEQYNSSFLTYS